MWLIAYDYTKYETISLNSIFLQDLDQKKIHVINNLACIRGPNPIFSTINSNPNPTLTLALALTLTVTLILT